MDKRTAKTEALPRARWERPVIKTILPVKRTQGGFFTYVEDTDTKNSS